jgi:hypothetical protein
MYSNVKIDDLRRSVAYILAMQSASLDDPYTGLSHEAIERLRNPPHSRVSLDDDRKTGACHIILTLQIIDKISHDKKYTNKLAIAKTATGKPPNHDSSAVTPLNTDACILEGVLEDNLKGATG